MNMKRLGVISAAAGAVLFYAPFALAYAYAGNGVAYAGNDVMTYGVPYQGYGYQNHGYQQPVAYPPYPVGNSQYAHPLDHNLYGPNTFTLSPSQFWIPAQNNGPTYYGYNGYGDNPYYGNGGYGSGYGGYGDYGYGGYGNYGGNYGGYGNNYGGGYSSGYGPYLPSYPSYDSSYAPYSNYYQAYPQVPHYMTGDTNFLGQQLCHWDDYQGANMPCGWDPQQWVYDPYTGTYY